MKLLAIVSIFCLSLPTLAEEASATLTNTSEAGVVLTTGNSESQSINLKHNSTYVWKSNTLRGDLGFLRSEGGNIETARSYSLGLRFEHALNESFSIFLAELLESNRFAGFERRLSTDAGAKYFLVKTDDDIGFIEAGYRFTTQKDVPLTTQNSNYLRFYAELAHQFTKTSGLTAGLEYLPNLSNSEDYQLNAALTLTATISETFSMKAGYAMKFDNLPSAAKKSDSTFTTALVAKF